MDGNGLKLEKEVGPTLPSFVVVSSKSGIF